METFPRLFVYFFDSLYYSNLGTHSEQKDQSATDYVRCIAFHMKIIIM